MRILLDECVNPRLGIAFPGEEVKTVAELGWRALSNGRLMRQAEQDFDVFLTIDRNVPHQNAVNTCKLGVVVLLTITNDLTSYRRHFAEIRDAVMKVRPGQVLRLDLE